LAGLDRHNPDEECAEGKYTVRIGNAYRVIDILRGIGFLGLAYLAEKRTEAKGGDATRCVLMAGYLWP
jgi:hypothetical protein